MTDIIKLIREANPSRSHICVGRRLLKILEELGETSEAYLSRTSRVNYKNKTWEDFREEAVDTLIVMLDVALTPLPWANWPAETLLHVHFEDGRLDPVRTIAELEKLMFDIAAAACAAHGAVSDQSKNGIIFYAAVGRGVRAAARLCYAIIPGETQDDINKTVFELVVKKIDKWRGRTTASVQEREPVQDAKSFIEHIEERYSDNF